MWRAQEDWRRRGRCTPSLIWISEWRRRDNCLIAVMCHTSENRSMCGMKVTTVLLRAQVIFSVVPEDFYNWSYTAMRAFASELIAWKLSIQRCRHARENWNWKVSLPLPGRMHPKFVNEFFFGLGLSYMGLRFSLEIARDFYRIALRGDSSNVVLYVDDVEQDISTRKRSKFIEITSSSVSIYKWPDKHFSYFESNAKCEDISQGDRKYWKVPAAAWYYRSSLTSIYNNNRHSSRVLIKKWSNIYSQSNKTQMRNWLHLISRTRSGELKFTFREMRGRHSNWKFKC